MAKKTKDIGHVRLSELKCAIAQMNSEQGIFIPFRPNACIFVSNKDGKTTVDLDIEVIPTPNSKYSDKMVKASLPKSFRDKNRISFDSDEYKALTPILGNLKTYEFEEKENTRTATAQPQAVSPVVDDLPEALDGNGQWGGPVPVSGNGWK